MGSGKRPHGLLNSVFNEMVHISTMIHAMAKLFTPMCSPRGGDHQKNTSLLIELWGEEGIQEQLEGTKEINACTIG